MDETVQQMLLMGMADADGIVQSVIPVGGSIDALPAPDTETVYFNATLGASATITSDEIDMTEWESAIIWFIEGTARNTTVYLVEEQTGVRGLAYYARDDAVGTVSVLQDANVTAGEKLYVVRNIGGGKYAIQLINNDALTAGTTTITAVRFNRRHN